MSPVSAPAPSSISAMPSKARWSALTSQAQTCLQTLQDEMQNYFDDRSEEWQEGDRGMAFQDRLDALETALEAILDLQSG